VAESAAPLSLPAQLRLGGDAGKVNENRPSARYSRRSTSVVPAHAGLFRSARSWSGPSSSRPRARGAVPPVIQVRLVSTESSPRTRGCSGQAARPPLAGPVVPAHAGLFPTTPPPAPTGRCRPRARGAVPARIALTGPSGRSSPRTRGCSRARAGREDSPDVVPAHAGLFLTRLTPSRAARSVVPAHAGLFRTGALRARRFRGRPRARGAVPGKVLDGAVPTESSPRTRGCSDGHHPHLGHPRVVPAHAGLFPGCRRSACR
jgi:hypothetical protein